MLYSNQAGHLLKPRKQTVFCGPFAMAVLTGESIGNIYTALGGYKEGLFSFEIINGMRKLRWHLQSWHGQNDMNGNVIDCLNMTKFIGYHPYGSYIVETSNHVVAYSDGQIADTLRGGPRPVEKWINRDPPTVSGWYEFVPFRRRSK